MAGLDKQVADVRKLIEARLGLTGADLADQLRRAGRMLPKPMRADGAILVEAHRNLTHPHLSRQVDQDAAQAAAGRLIAHLKTVDPSQRRRTKILGTLSVIGFNLIVLFVILVVVLVWRGFV